MDIHYLHKHIEIFHERSISKKKNFFFFYDLPEEW